MNKSKKYTIIGLLLILVLIGFVWLLGNTYKKESDTQNNTSEFDSISGGIDWSAFPTNELVLSNQGVLITTEGTYVLKGTSTGQVLVDTDGYVRLILNDITINSDTGAAIQIDSAEKVVIELADGTINTISDASTRVDDEIDGAIYSSDDLVFTGNGTLNLTSNFQDAIVGKDDLWIESGGINITSVDDGIRGKDSLNISGGIITIDALGDGIKSSNDTDLGKGQLNISGGEITISFGDDAIKAEQKVWITGGIIDVITSVEGIEAPVIIIDGGDINIFATDDGINASASSIITSGLGITINGGNVTVEVGTGDTDALDSNGDLTITGGTITLIAQSAIDFDGIGTFTGGILIVNGEKLDQLPAQMMGLGGPRN